MVKSVVIQIGAAGQNPKAAGIIDPRDLDTKIIDDAEREVLVHEFCTLKMGDNIANRIEFAILAHPHFKSLGELPKLADPQFLPFEGHEGGLQALVPIGVSPVDRSKFLLQKPNPELIYEPARTPMGSVVAAIHGIVLEVPNAVAANIIDIWNESHRASSFVMPTSPNVLNFIDNIILINLPLPDLKFYMQPAKNLSGLYLLQHEGLLLEGKTKVSPALFSEVERHLEKVQASSPLDWATKRIQIAAGYLYAIDAPSQLAQVEKAYRLMAPYVFADVRTNRELRFNDRMGLFHLHQENLEVLSQLSKASGAQSLEDLNPELLMLFLNEKDEASGSVLSDSVTLEFIKSYDLLKQNGLNFRNLRKFHADAMEAGMERGEALLFVLELSQNIFSAPKPWWFNEDLDFREYFYNPGEERPGALFRYNSEDLALASEIAYYAGHSWAFAAEIFAKAGKSLASLEGVDLSKAISFTSQIARAYGIENSTRGINIAQCAHAFLKEQSPANREKAMDTLTDLLVSEAPASPALCKIESSRNGAIRLPGLRFHPDLKTQASNEEPNCGSDLFSLSELKELDSRITCAPTFSSILEFYSQLKRVCGGFDKNVANYYFEYCAHNSANPFKPWDGFLEIVQKYVGVLAVANEPEPEEDQDITTLSTRLGMPGDPLARLVKLETLGVGTKNGLGIIVEWLAGEEGLKLVEADFREVLSQQRPVIFLNYRRGTAKQGFGPCDIVTANERTDQHITEELKKKMHSVRHTLCNMRFMRLQGVVNIIEPSQGKYATLREFIKDANLLLNETLAAPDKALLFVAKEEPDPVRAAEDFLDSSSGLRAILPKVLRSKVAKDIRDLVRHWNKIQDALIAGQARLEINAAVEAIAEQLPSVREGIRDPYAYATELLSNIRAVASTAELFMQAPQGAFETAVKKLILHEFGADNLMRLLPAMARFELEGIPLLLRKLITPEEFRDLNHSNTISARTTFLIGSRLNKTRSEIVAHLEKTHDQNSPVALVSGLRVFEQFLDPSMQASKEGDALYESLIARIPAMLKRTDQWRLADVPYGPIGGRINCRSTISDEQVQIMSGFLGLEKTPFRLIHNNTSLILPVSLSRHEFRSFLFLAAMQGLLDPRYPELQLGVASRLSPELCAILGSSSILGTWECAPFEVNSFVADPSNNRLTGARMVAYDAYPESEGKRRNFDLPFMVECENDGSPSSRSLHGRTDVLGRWHIRWDVGSDLPNILSIDDLDIVHSVGASLRQVQHGGPLKDLGEEFIERHKFVLKKYKLESVLKAEWVYLREEDAYTTSNDNNRLHFEKAVQPCMSAHFAMAKDFARNKGIVFDTRSNIAWLIEEGSKIGQSVRSDPRWTFHVDALRHSML